jgi:hypothetical protein
MRCPAEFLKTISRTGAGHSDFKVCLPAGKPPSYYSDPGQRSEKEGHLVKHLIRVVHAVYPSF